MKRALGLGIAIGLAAAALPGWPAQANGLLAVTTGLKTQHGAVVHISKRSKTPVVRGYSLRRGGYSYVPADVINTYGNSRTLYGGTNVYRDPTLDRQSPAGPFDHGFFFDSAIQPRGGQSPYLN